ncbi:unannotated protein [freshwater metagenome]|uniref:Unannotated protein n=1 Tax=freshwater metagenome TaxID=449393 RepID=A0A6J6Z547_9ZZZZ
MLLGSGHDDLEVHVGNLCADVNEIHDSHIVDADDGMRVPHVNVRHRAIGVHPDSVPRQRRHAGGGNAHGNARHDHGGVVGGHHLHLLLAGVGHDTVGTGPGVADGLDETANAVAAHAGAGSVGIEQDHSPRAVRTQVREQQSVSTDTTVPIAPADRELAASALEPADPNQKVVAESVMLGEAHCCTAHAITATASTGNASNESISISIQRMRGSLRNQRSWRTAN